MQKRRMPLVGMLGVAVLCALPLSGGLTPTEINSESAAVAADKNTGMKELLAEKNTAAQTSRAELLKTFHSEFVAITPGTGDFPKSFVMGTDRGPVWEEPAHKVTFGYAFEIAKYEVPQNLYEEVMGENPSRWKGPRNSAENFTWDEALAFCEKITKLLRDAALIRDTELIRLPTEAEWEYCCRAGTSTPYSFGESAIKPGDTHHLASILSLYAWHTGNAAGNDPAVGVLKPNPWGLYDMHGYLWEFVSDAWHDNYVGAPANGSAWESANPESPRVLRGGSWRERYECHRSAFRIPVARGVHNEAIGFRCVKSNVNRE